MTPWLEEILQSSTASHKGKGTGTIRALRHLSKQKDSVFANRLVILVYVLLSVVLEPIAEDVSEPVRESSLDKHSQEPTAAEDHPGALVSEPPEAELASEPVPEDAVPEPSVVEAVPEALVSESTPIEPTGEEVTLEAAVTEASVTEEKSPEEPPAPVVESGKPDASAWRPGDVFMFKTNEGPRLSLRCFFSFFFFFFTCGIVVNFFSAFTLGKNQQSLCLRWWQEACLRLHP